MILIDLDSKSTNLNRMAAYGEWKRTNHETNGEATKSKINLTAMAFAALALLRQVIENTYISEPVYQINQFAFSDAPIYQNIFDALTFVEHFYAGRASCIPT